MNSLVDILMRVAASARESVRGDETNERHEQTPVARVGLPALVIVGHGGDGLRVDQHHRESVCAEDWLERYRERLAAFSALHGPEEARRRAFGTLQVMWHREHGPRAPATSCAGCGGKIGDDPALDLADGTRVHDRGDHACLIAYGGLWRGRAADALSAEGIPRPPDDAAGVITDDQGHDHR